MEGDFVQKINFSSGEYPNENLEEVIMTIESTFKREVANFLGGENKKGQYDIHVLSVKIEKECNAGLRESYLLIDVYWEEEFWSGYNDMEIEYDSITMCPVEIKTGYMCLCCEIPQMIIVAVLIKL